MFRFFKRKQEKKAADNFALLANMLKEEQAASISEPWTLAKARLEGGAKDAGAGKGLRMYNAHLSRLQNQWINPLQSVNSGYGTAHASLFLYQPVNYYECYSLAQDPLFAKVFNVLSETPFAKGGELSNLSAEEKDRVEEAASGEKNSVVLLEVADNKDNFEIVHFHWAKNKQRRTLEKKAERIKEKS